MSIVRYTNKKTGQVALYESTSHYDPKTKQSRPIRKYLGIEDPETGALIPSSGKRGRKGKGDNSDSKETVLRNSETDFKQIIETLERQNSEKDREIKRLGHENQKLQTAFKRLQSIIDEINASSEDIR